MATGTPRQRLTAGIAAGAGVCAALLLQPGGPSTELGAGAQSGLNLDKVMAAYAAGDHQAVVRAFTRSADFQTIRALDTQRIRNGLGPWQRAKAAALLELTNISSSIAPAYTTSLLAVGQDYVLRQPGGTSPDQDREFIRVWHRIVIALLERRYFDDAIDSYVSDVRVAHAAGAVPWDARLELGRAVAQEQRCWNSRPGLRFPSVDLGPGVPGAGVPAREAERATRCLEEAVTRFEAAAIGDAQPEARVRAGWVLHQLGRHADARRSLDAAEVVDDSDLAYWRSLFRGRVHLALERHADAERDYRDALESHPDAQSAGVGLALVLFRLHRDVEADEIAVSVRTRSGSAVDPWRIYLTADERFIDRWLTELRRLLQ